MAKKNFFAVAALALASASVILAIVIGFRVVADSPDRKAPAAQIEIHPVLPKIERKKQYPAPVMEEKETKRKAVLAVLILFNSRGTGGE